MKKRRKGRANATGRNDGERYAKLDYPLLQSDAFRSLSGSAVKVFIELRTRFNGGNNGSLELSLDRAATLLRIGKATVKRAFAELQEKGFVVETEKGHWYRRKPSQWAVTTLGRGNALPTNDWKNWKPPRRPPHIRRDLEILDGALAEKQLLGSETDR